MSEEAIQCVTGFIKDMNEWGHIMNIVSRLSSGQVINHAADRELIPKESYDEYLKKYYDVFNRYCTKRKRKYGGHPASYSRHGIYAGMSRDTIKNIERVNSKRIEILVSGGQLPEEIKFILLYRNDKWLIDSAKHYSDRGWETYHL